MARKKMSFGALKALLEGLAMVVLALLGWFFAVPEFGAFGVVWTIAAAGVAAVDLYRALIKSRWMRKEPPEEENKP